MSATQPTITRPLRPQPSSNKDSSTASELIRIARNSLLVLNARDFSHTSPSGREVLSRISSSYTAQLDNYPTPLTWLQLNDVWRQWAAEDQRLTFNMRECEADVDVDEGEATVYMDMDVVGLAGVEMKGFTVLRWRREAGGQWMVREFWAMRGMHAMGDPMSH